MIREDIEKIVEPIICECLRKFGDFSPPDTSVEGFAKATRGHLRPDVRRVSLLLSLAQLVAGPGFAGEGLELGCGYGYLLFPFALYFPKIRWTGVEHPDRAYFNRPDFLQAFRDYHCKLVGTDFVHESLPFPDQHFSMATLSETLEHLPLERLGFILSEIHRVMAPGGFLITSSPNQASLENRILLLRGKSILNLPEYVAHANGTFGHIRLYTPDEMILMMGKLGFTLERSALESNNSAYRGSSSKSLRRRLYRLYETAEQCFDFLRTFGDTWYMVFRKNTPMLSWKSARTSSEK